MLLAVPNVSEGRDLRAVDAIGRAYVRGGARLLDTHADPDHHRAVHTLAGAPGALAQAVLAGAREVLERIDLTTPRGLHPHVGALDVAPIVHLDAARRGAAIAEALVLAHGLGEQGLPVYLYGLLAGGRTRAELRLAKHLPPPDFGPRHADPRHGAVLVAARPPLVAFNFEVAGTLEDARQIAARVRRHPDVVALGLWLDARGTAQVSTNVEGPPLAEVLELVGPSVTACEQVGLAPRAAYDGWPDAVTVRGRRIIEDLL